MSLFECANRARIRRALATGASVAVLAITLSTGPTSHWMRST